MCIRDSHFNTPYTLLNVLYSVVKERSRSSREPRTIQRATTRVKGPARGTQLRVVSLREPHRDSPSGAVNRQERKTEAENTNRHAQSQADSFVTLHLIHLIMVRKPGHNVID